jgi:adenosylcobinamide-phosphate synthase
MVDVLIAYLLDLVVGDPERFPHPIKGIGKCISFFEKIVRRVIPWERVGGGILTILIIGGTYLSVHYMVTFLSHLSSGIGLVANIILLSVAFSTRSLGAEAIKVYRYLIKDELMKARSHVSRIVGRDVDHLSKREVIRAAVESVAENTTDGVVAPLFYAFLGGAPLVYAYKAVNTLDSMIGYKDERYAKFGFFSAKVDDLANFAPARIVGFLMPFCAFLVGGSFRETLSIIHRDGGKHPSPNSGIPQAGVAGALRVRLGGLNYYRGVPSQKPFIGEGKEELKVEHIKASVRMMYIISLLFVGGSFLFLKLMIRN